MIRPTSPVAGQAKSVLDEGLSAKACQVFVNRQKDLIVVERGGSQSLWGKASGGPLHTFPASRFGGTSSHHIYEIAGGLCAERRDESLRLQNSKGGHIELQQTDENTSAQLLSGRALVGLPPARRPALLAALGQATPHYPADSYAYVDVPRYGLGEHFRLYIASPERSPRQLMVTGESVLLDGGTTTLNTDIGSFYFPSQWKKKGPPVFYPEPGPDEADLPVGPEIDEADEFDIEKVADALAQWRAYDEAVESRKIVLSWVSLADNGPLIASLRIPDVDATVALPDLGAIDEARREAFDATQHLHDSRIASYFGSPDVTVMGRALYLAGDAPPLCAPDRYGRMQPWPKHQEPGDKELQLRCNYGGTTALILQGDAKLLAQASHEPSPCLVTDNPSVARRIFAGACTLREGDPKTVLRDKFRDITGR